MRSDFESAINSLIAASGGRVWLVSGDRDTATQQRLWDEAVAQYGSEEARNWVAPPGNSNHEKGIAVDLGGDLELAAQLASRFGLWRPMDWEPWHFEPIGSRDGSTDQTYTNTPTGYRSPQDKVTARSIKDVLDSALGGIPSLRIPEDGLVSQYRTSVARMTLSPNRANAPVFTTRSGGPTGIDAFMAAIRAVESSGNYSIINPSSGASGAYQFMDGTWAGYGGYSSARYAPPEIQDEYARQLMQEYYNRYGDWDSVAAAWVSGPNGNWQSGEVQDYVSKVRAHL